jgi:hypothetical protein
VSVFAIWLAGGELSELKATEAFLVKYAKERGFQYINLGGRKGWMSVLDGYREGGRMYYKELV